MVRAEVMGSLSRRMRPSGVLHIATDVPGYPEQVRELLASPALARAWTPRPSSCAERWRPSTKYERDGLAAGREVEDLCFVFDADATDDVL